MPHYWTKIASASAAEQNDQVYEDEATGTVFVLGQAEDVTSARRLVT